jgi:hypothetical protein
MSGHTRERKGNQHFVGWAGISISKRVGHGSFHVTEEYLEDGDGLQVVPRRDDARMG